MTDHTEIFVTRVVKIQVPPEQEQAAHAADVAAQPPGPEQALARAALFAAPVDPLAQLRQTSAPDHPATPEEQQAAAAMVLMYAQQLLLSHAKQERRLPSPPERPRLDEEDPEDA